MCPAPCQANLGAYNYTATWGGPASPVELRRRTMITSSHPRGRPAVASRHVTRPPTGSAVAMTFRRKVVARTSTCLSV